MLDSRMALENDFSPILNEIDKSEQEPIFLRKITSQKLSTK